MIDKDYELKKYNKFTVALSFVIFFNALIQMLNSFVITAQPLKNIIGIITMCIAMPALTISFYRQIHTLKSLICRDINNKLDNLLKDRRWKQVLKKSDSTTIDREYMFVDFEGRIIKFNVFVEIESKLSKYLMFVSSADEEPLKDDDKIANQIFSKVFIDRIANLLKDFDETYDKELERIRRQAIEDMEYELD